MPPDATPQVSTHRNSAFSAPKICTVLAGYFARLVSDPAQALCVSLNAPAAWSPINNTMPEVHVILHRALKRLIHNMKSRQISVLIRTTASS